MRNTVDILGVAIDNVTMSQALEKLKAFLEDDKANTVYTPNAEIMMDAKKDPSLKAILNSGSLVVADGAGVVLSSKILGVSLPEKVSGIDLVRNFFSMDSKRKTRYFLFGSKPGTAEAAGENIKKLYTGVEIAGCRNGFFTEKEEASIIAQINSSGADILLVALGAPKQERWIHKNKARLNVKVCIGVGGSLDVFAGKVKLAPEFFRQHGLEWLYRLYKEPWRYKRMLKLPKFMLASLVHRLKGS